MFDIRKVLSGKAAEQKDTKSVFKFRLLYNKKDFTTEFVKYKLPKIKILKPVFDDTIEYGCKFSDRSKINKLSGLKKDADDILIIKNGLVTDTSFANIIFSDGKQWFTPDKPLLKGTMRAFMLDMGIIKAIEIRFTDIEKFEKARIINAMIKFENELDVIIK
jgi:4-amino-4-deoxychorismate lyase